MRLADSHWNVGSLAQRVRKTRILIEVSSGNRAFRVAATVHNWSDRFRHGNLTAGMARIKLISGTDRMGPVTDSQVPGSAQRF
jgi:hypothetical protein